jgi:hypothetical protein
MSRGLPSALATAASSDLFPPAFFVELDWPGGVVRVWTHYGDISWGGNTWVGTGHLGSIGNIAESDDLRANGIALKLSGIPSANVALALANDSQGRDGKVYLGAMDGAGGLVSDPIVVFAGFIDFTVIEDDGTTASITVQLAKEFTNRKAQPRRYTHEDQQIDHPGDMFFEFLAGNLGKEFAWGRQVIPAAGNTPGTGSDGSEGVD